MDIFCDMLLYIGLYVVLVISGLYKRSMRQMNLLRSF